MLTTDGEGRPMGIKIECAGCGGGEYPLAELLRTALADPEMDTEDRDNLALGIESIYHQVVTATMAAFNLQGSAGISRLHEDISETVGPLFEAELFRLETTHRTNSVVGVIEVMLAPMPGDMFGLGPGGMYSEPDIRMPSLGMPFFEMRPEDLVHLLDGMSMIDTTSKPSAGMLSGPPPHRKRSFLGRILRRRR